jgi:hypothetical protein
MRNRLIILVLGIALGFAAKGVKWAYDAATAEKPNGTPASAIEAPGPLLGR